jgi:hypothetical protein
LKFKITYNNEQLPTMQEDNNVRSGISHHKFIRMGKNIVIKEIVPQGRSTSFPRE